MEGWLNTRFTIVVGAVGKNGYFASYSTTGAAVFVSGPGGDREYVGNHITAFVTGGCVDAGVGTSYATPAVAGVIALMLEVNPDLTWREVQGILALTSQRVYPDDESWEENAAGLAHSYKFGFGVADAFAAVEASRTWQKWGPEKQVVRDSQALDTQLSNDATSGDVFKLSISSEQLQSEVDATNMAVESVVVYLHLNHSSRGDLEITLLSPAGTQSILSPAPRPENSLLPPDQKWKLLTVRNWEESPIGDWTLKIVDKNPDNVNGCLDLPWQYLNDTLFGPEMVTCGTLNLTEDVESCMDLPRLADISEVEYAGNTLLTACCDCGGGINASSLPNTLISWQLIVYGHTEPTSGANNDDLSEPCNNACDRQTEFCGNDNKCHRFSCPEFYQFGDPEMTGYNPDNPEELICEEYVGAEDDLANAIVYGCEGVLPFGTTPDPDVVPFWFNRVCNVTLPRGLEFFCVDVMPNTSFSAYETEVDEFTVPACEGDLEPMYHYTLFDREEIDGNRTQDAIRRSSESLNESLAMSTGVVVLRDGQDPCYPSGPEACKWEQMFNGVCDDCVGDCFDCDPCREEYSFTDCETCTNAGCVWCSSDASCYSDPLDSTFWLNYEGRKTTSCPTATDWVSAGNCARSNSSAYPDPLYDAMAWSYRILNVENVWRSAITGKGIHIRVNDDGVDSTHPEFTPNFDSESSCDVYLPLTDFDDHGTSCASLIAASTNDVCAVGIAHGATLSACTMNMEAEDPEAEFAMFLTGLNSVDVSSNSWGPNTCFTDSDRARKLQETCPFSEESFDSPCKVCESAGYDSIACEDAVSKYCLSHYETDPVACAEYLDYFVTECNYHTLSPQVNEAFVKAIMEGRDGKGTIFVFAAGNDLTKGVNTNNDGYINSRFTIAVGAVGKDGYHASYSTPGSAVFVSGPGGDKESVANMIVARPGGGCHDVGYGTSFAAPTVAGVIGLLLEANSELTWRDVQEVLAQTATMADPDDDSWVANAANYNHSYKYGFGIVDAGEAVNTAKAWKNLPEEQQTEASSGEVNVAIPDDGTSVTSTVEASVPGGNFVMESVIAYLKISHPTRGDLSINLTSPSGTASVLAEGGRPEETQQKANESWKLMTLRCWGENPNGKWTLSMADLKVGSWSDCVDSTWIYTDSDGVKYTCDDFVDVTDCSDETQVPAEMASFSYNNITPTDACCACSGGTDVSKLQPQLISWRLMMYGHSSALGSSLKPNTTAGKSGALASFSNLMFAVASNVGLALYLLLPASLPQR